MEHCLRHTVIALRLADLVEADAGDREATYYLGLLSNACCHADASEEAKWFGDDISFKADGYEVLAMNTVQVAALFLRALGSHGVPTDRLRRLATFPGTGQREIEPWLKAHTPLGAQFAERVGLLAGAADAIPQAYEQWDGKGPRHLR